MTLTILVVHAYGKHLFNVDLFYLDLKNFSIIQNYVLIMNMWNQPLDYRISGLFYSESILGSFLSKVLPIYIALLFYYEKKSSLLKKSINLRPIHLFTNRLVKGAILV